MYHDKIVQKQPFFYAQRNSPYNNFNESKTRLPQKFYAKKFYSKIQQKSAVVDNSEIQTNINNYKPRLTCYIDNFEFR